MAIQTQGTTGSVMEVDVTHKASRVSLRPMEVLAWQSLGAQTGLITALAAGAAIFSFRNISSNLIVLRRAGIGFLTTTAFTTAQQVDFGIMAARAFTASDTGGTAIALTGNNGKHRTSLATLTSVDCRIAAAVALTAGTRTLDANTLAQQGGWAGGAGTTIPPAPENLLQQAAGDYPLVLGQNEGFVIQVVTAMGAAGVGRAFVNLELAEVASY